MLTVLAEGAGFVAIAKPPGRIVVPGRGAAAGEVTLRQELEQQLGRALLVVHRLDRGTSGVLVFATDAAAHRGLSRAFEHHAVVKRYLALVRGALIGSGDIDLPLVPVRGGLVRVGRPGETAGKASQTGWRALERLGDFTLVEFRPRTGRLHQIRAHAQALGHPLAVDARYGGAVHLTLDDVRPRAPGDAPAAREVVLARPPLHAWSIKLPSGGPARSGASITIEAPIAADLARVLALLRGATDA